MPIKFGDASGNSRAKYRIVGDPDLSVGSIRDNASLDVAIESGSPTADTKGVVALASVNVFLSYRRDDGAGYAGRLHDDLAACLPNASIFYDVDAIRPGSRFKADIANALRRSDAVVILIGPHWLAAGSNGGESRLFDHEDLVRLEIETALAASGTIIPILIRGAALPLKEQLPKSIRPILEVQALALSDATWHSDVRALARRLADLST
jgi:TIR domain-containing protein